MIVFYKGFTYDVRNKTWQELPSLLGVPSPGNLSEFIVSLEYWDGRGARFLEVEAVNSASFEALKSLPERNLNPSKAGRVKIKYKRGRKEKGKSKYEKYKYHVFKIDFICPALLHLQRLFLRI